MNKLLSAKKKKRKHKPSRDTPHVRSADKKKVSSKKCAPNSDTNNSKLTTPSQYNNHDSSAMILIIMDKISTRSIPPSTYLFPSPPTQTSGGFKIEEPRHVVAGNYYPKLVHLRL